MWLSGYLLTWISKWLIVSIVLKMNVIELISQRTVGKVQDTPLLDQLKNALISNIREIFPFNLTESTTGTILMILVVLFLLFAIWFLYRKR